MTETILKATSLRKTYGARGVDYPALDGVDLRVAAGEFVGIMGPSGAGKTTLLNILATIDRPSGGNVEFAGADLAALRGERLAAFRRERLGFIFQDFNLLDTLSVRENIALPLALAGRPAADITRAVDEAMEALGIAPLADKRPSELSGGQKQRAAAARAIVGRPGLVLADEPTGNLDSRSARELLQSLSALNTERGATILMVTHDAFAASWCSRVVFLKDGRTFGELVNGGDRGAFFDRIIDSLRALEGGAR